MGSIDKAITIEDLRRLALSRLPHFVGDYVERGAGDGSGVVRNVDAFRKYEFVPRVLVDVTPVDASVSLFGHSYASPFGISAVGTSGIYRRGADVMLADAARRANIPFILSGASSSSLEEVLKVAPENTWYQLYGAKDPELTRMMVTRAQDAGVRVLVFTVDFPIPQQSEVIARTGISLGSGPTLRSFPRVFWDALCHPGWTTRFLSGGGMPRLESWAPFAPPGSTGKEIARFYYANWLGNRTWTDLEQIRQWWRGKLVVKGIVHPADAARAFAIGADAVSVSNHGANKLDRMQGCVDALSAVRAAVGPDATLFFDGGIRRGSDIIVAHALGANCAFVGRATLYGVAAGGNAGARRAVEILRSGVEYTMAMLGCKTVDRIHRGHLAPVEIDRAGPLPAMQASLETV